MLLAAGSVFPNLVMSSPIPSPAEAAAEPPADGGAVWIFGDCVQSRNTRRENPESGQISMDFADTPCVSGCVPCNTAPTKYI